MSVISGTRLPSVDITRHQSRAANYHRPAAVQLPFRDGREFVVVVHCRASFMSAVLFFVFFSEPEN